VSFAKIRGSYGTTGNDQIGDYGYLDLWSPVNVTSPYQGIPAFTPTRLFNTDYAWEVNRKLEGAVEIGLFRDRLLASVAFYRNRSSNQLIAYSLPSQTGFTSLGNKNFPAVVQNSGLEITFTAKNTSSKNFSWTTSVNLTIPRNKLVSFPGIENSAYASTLEVGQPITIQTGYLYNGVNSSTGLFEVVDVNPDGIIDTKDLVHSGNRDPKFYGGMSNTFSYRSFELYFLVDGRKQSGVNTLLSIYGGSSTPPGRINTDQWNNQPVSILNRWVKQGDVAQFQKYTATSGTPAYNALQNYLLSNAFLTDASFIRLRTLSMAYHLGEAALKKMHLSNFRIFIQGQNLLTVTGYKNSDPETQNAFALPPLRTITAGFTCTF
jgi:hypothetical protein